MPIAQEKTAESAAITQGRQTLPKPVPTIASAAAAKADCSASMTKTSKAAKEARSRFIVPVLPAPCESCFHKTDNLAASDHRIQETGRKARIKKDSTYITLSRAIARKSPYLVTMTATEVNSNLSSASAYMSEETRATAMVRIQAEAEELPAYWAMAATEHADAAK